MPANFIPLARAMVLVGFCALTCMYGQISSSPDQTFIQDAAKGGILEVHMGQLALQRASNPAVKAYAERLIADHTKGNEELESLAKKKGVAVPPDDAKMAMSMSIATKSGADFDREYVKTMVTDHQKTIEMFEKEASSGSDPDVKDWANKTLPTLRSHLADAQALAK
jgi:putative membrane protein